MIVTQATPQVARLESPLHAQDEPKPYAEHSERTIAGTVRSLISLGKLKKKHACNEQCMKYQQGRYQSEL